jgi:hypothetical protein
VNWIDKKGRIGGVIHWLDLILLVMVIIIIIRAIIFAWPRFEHKEERVIRLEVMAYGLYKDQAESITAGQWVKDQASGEFMGKVINKEILSCFLDRLEASNPQQSASSERQDIMLVLERSGRINEREGIYLGKETVRSGQERMFHTLYTEFQGRISRIILFKE